MSPFLQDPKCWKKYVLEYEEKDPSLLIRIYMMSFIKGRPPINLLVSVLCKMLPHTPSPTIMSYTDLEGIIYVWLSPQTLITQGTIKNNSDDKRKPPNTSSSKWSQAQLDKLVSNNLPCEECPPGCSSHSCLVVNKWWGEDKSIDNKS